MKKSILLISCILFLITMIGQLLGQNNQKSSDYFPLPSVDRRVELLSIVFRLAGNWEYNDERYKEYVKDIHQHFDKYKDHPCITFAIEVRNKTGISFDAVMAMAVHIEQPPTLNPVVPFSADIPARKWGKDDAFEFVKLLQQFYIDAKCEEFFNQHKVLYKLAQDRFNPIYNSVDLKWYEQYYGIKPKGSFNILLGLGNGGCNYGVKVIYSDTKVDAYSVMGNWVIDSVGKPVFSVNDFLPTLIHEFNHSFVNYLIDKNEKELENAGKILFEPVKDIMIRQAYSSWQTMMKEALVRASVIKYIEKHNNDTQAAYNELIAQLSRGFVWMKELVDTLELYENNRDKYPTLESFMPRIISFYNNVAKNNKVLFENCAKVISTEPFQNNSTDVSPDITEMKIIFNKPLSAKDIEKSIWLGNKGKEHYPIIENGIRLSDNNTTITLSIKLKANTEYDFRLVGEFGQSIKTLEGYPLIGDYNVLFKTK